jgi:N-acetylglutamate synthase-like GNAT family acetyltransferase
MHEDSEHTVSNSGIDIALEGREDFHHYAMYEETGQLLGAAAVRHGSDPGVTYVGAIAVAPEVRGQGYGHLLIQHLARAARAAGDTGLLLFPLASARPAYERMGFIALDDGHMLLAVSE